jgi:IS30 family transposase
MGKRYNHLSLEERDKITVMKSEGKAISEIARVIGRNKGTISRELQRNSSSEYKLYLSHRAQGRAEQRKQEACERPRLKNNRIKLYVRNKLSEGWSPEQISGRIKKEHACFSISHEAIYQYIYDSKTSDRKELIGCLRRAHRKRKLKGIGRKTKKTKIPNRTPIDARPTSVETRQQFGHWEGDSLISRKSTVSLNSLVERKSRLLILTKLKRKSADETNKAVVKRLNGFPQKSRRTLTMDNGSENAGHQKITSAIGIKCYFAQPYASWQRGTNENTNGLIRWYLPKGTDFSKISDEHIAQIESLINNRPRKCLGFRTPIEVASSFVALRG